MSADNALSTRTRAGAQMLATAMGEGWHVVRGRGTPWEVRDRDDRVRVFRPNDVGSWRAALLVEPAMNLRAEGDTPIEALSRLVQRVNDLAHALASAASVANQALTSLIVADANIAAQKGS